MISLIDGHNYQARISYSNRFAFIQIFELNREHGQEFAFDKAIAESLEAAKGAKEVDTIIESHYKGKRGKRCL